MNRVKEDAMSRVASVWLNLKLSHIETSLFLWSNAYS